MHPLKQIKKLLSSDSPNSAKVVSVSGRSLTVATRLGSQTIARSPGDATRYQPGDEVVLANGQVVGRRSRTPTIYVV